MINPLVYHFSGTTGPDGGNCGNKWATDTYDATFIVEPQVETVDGQIGGSYTIVKIIDGTFVTRAGTSQPNPTPPAPAVARNPPDRWSNWKVPRNHILERAKPGTRPGTFL